MQAYALQAQALVKSSPKDALTLAEKAVSLDGDYSAYYALGLAQHANADDSGAKISLEKARAMAADAKPAADTATRVAIDEQLLTLASARKDSGEVTDLTTEINKLEPGMSGKMTAYTYDQQGLALQNRGDYQGAVKMYEQAAAADPSWAGAIDYTKAAIAYASMPTPNYLAAKSDVEKATAVNPNYAVAYFVDAVVLWRYSQVTGNEDTMQDADLAARKAAGLARAEGDAKLAEEAAYFAQNHTLRSNLEQWSTQLTCKTTSC
jgi:tetratricopeptide (TPR) repeat protein